MSTRKTAAQKQAVATPPPPPSPAEQPISLLLEFTKNSPHSAGWNKTAAIAAAREFASMVNEGMTPMQVWTLMNAYKDVAGWNNCNRAMAEKYGFGKMKGE